jgi:protein SCO1/2
LLAVALAGCGAVGEASPGGGQRHATASIAGKLEAPAELEPVRPAPEIALRNYTGEPVRLSQFRGKAVLLTFIYDHCPDTCPLIVSRLHTALQMLGHNADKVQVVAVSVDPAGDTPKTVRAFLAKREMLGRMDYLLGSLRELAPVWQKYAIAVEATPESRESPLNRTVSHSAFVYGITASGKWLALYNQAFDPAEIVHDVPLLASS